ncbi:MAG TPA: methyltransferase domain-containing protein [Candidatus Acidoferrales bacterium]|nr:methyltransferase domain-containing protein [Candidatus Acidoferrales bacterium]
MSVEKSYVLGTHDEEIARLSLQNAVWRPRATAAWRRAGFSAGQTIVDLGCGPGWASLDLADVVGASGRVVAIDRSRRFLEHLERAAAARGLANVEIRERDLNEGALPVENVDGIWSRWVYAFVRDPRGLLARAARAIRPGGTLVMHEYSDYRTWKVSPHEPEFEAFVKDVMVSWREQGGEPDVGLELPVWASELGLEVKSLTPIQDAARPGDPVWQWPRAFVGVGLQRLVDVGRIDASRAGAIRDAWARLEASPHAFTVTPVVLEIIASRRA